MLLDSIEFRLARRKVERFDRPNGESSATPSASDIARLEATLEQGIEAFETLEHAEAVVAEGAAEGILELTSDWDHALEALVQTWVSRSEIAKRWLENVRPMAAIRPQARFEACCERAAEWLSRRAHYRAIKAARDENFAREGW